MNKQSPQRFNCLIVVAVLLAAMGQTWAKPALPSGFSVATQNIGGGNNFQWGCVGYIMRYDIENGQTVKTTKIYDGKARFSTISPDGRNVAFIKLNCASPSNSSLCPAEIMLMDAAGGTPVSLLSVPDGWARCALDWPSDAGDWLYDGLGTSTSTDVQGMNEIWKVNIKTKEKVKLCSTTDRFWQMGIAKGGRVALRPFWSDDAAGTPVFVFTLPSSDQTITVTRADPTHIIGGGCGVDIAPSGNTVMHVEITHTRVYFYNWNGTKITNMSTFQMSLPDTFFGQGTNNNRWSSNSDKWLCLGSCWLGRGGDEGTNQVLVNWVDTQLIRTSRSYPGSTGIADKYEQNEAGDFWISDISTPVKAAAINQSRPATLNRRYCTVATTNMSGNLLKNNAKVWDLKGRSLSGKTATAKRPAVYIVEEAVTPRQ